MQKRHPFLYGLFWLVIVWVLLAGVAYAAGFRMDTCPKGYVATGDRLDNCEPLGITVPIPVGYNGPLPDGATPAVEIGG